MKGMRFLIICTLLWVLAITTVLAETVLEQVRVSDTSVMTRVVFELSDSFDYKNFGLTSPMRHVIDFKNVKMDADLPSKLLAGSALKKIRASENNQQLRIVLDLRDRVGVKVSEIPRQGDAGPRLVVDLAHPTHAMSSAQLAHQDQEDADETVDEVDNDPEAVPVAPKRILKLAKRSGARDIVVVIDPGHGGKDPGARGAQGSKEKDIVLAIAKKLQAAINREPGFRAVLTRDGDYFIGLRGRLAIAHKHKGDMFIAIHADAARHETAKGIGVYAVSQRGATSEAARWLAAKENESEFVGGLDLTDKDHVLRSVLIDLSQTHTISASLQIGSVLLRQLSRFAELHHAGVEQAAFVVLKSPDIPSLLVETGFLSNPYEERKLLNPQYQWQIVGAVTSGIKTYFVNHPPRGTQIALCTGANQT